ncbi:putative membrane protein YhhN [Lutibacter sp. Hel_I_33_5]|uniref:lysoplasmalogenase n=1 Tax=Lutibacter sp. Hel_I_33_5 TaxID=1566289 RepID=UPI0011A46F03|nr:lysoplasmalogenase [Lutibacter sp. Hel_I_33_5]TVZ55425.1 putative membrane protein YhhN [Lutibacter sp. Hel_I_33_5]
MSKKSKITLASIFFLIVVIVDVYAVITHNTLLEQIFKPLLMTSLVLVYLASVKKPNFWYVSALFFCFWGDVFLLDKPNFFTFGLASFLVGHIIYIKISKDFLKQEITAKMISSSFPFVIIFCVLMYLVYPNLGNMLLPVLVYGIVISTFGAITLLNYRQEKSTENLWLSLGALVFIVSDSLIAIHRFYEAKEIYSIAIIITYIVAQYLICKAMIAKNN